MKGWKKAAACLTAAAIVLGSSGALPDGIFDGVVITASADDTSSETWYIVDGKLRAYHGTDTHIVIPETVYKIEDEVFMNNTNIVSVTFPAKLESIGENAFLGCTKLSDLDFSKSKHSLVFDYNVFKGCTALKEVELPAVYIDSLSDGDLFEDCVNIEKVSYAEGSTRVGKGIFAGLKGLKTVVIPDSVETIEDHAFKECTNLSEITLPSQLKTIGEGAFEFCTGLTELPIPDGVTLIDDYAFYKCTNLKTQMPASLKKIGKHAFDFCTSLTDIVLPEGFETIYEYAFGHCTGLTYMNIPSTFKYANGVLLACGEEDEFYGPFAYCENIQEYDIANGIPKLENVLAGCRGVTRVVIPPSVTEICDADFYDCDKLSSVTVPDSVHYVGSYAFSGCKQLTSLSFSGLDRIENNAFSSCYRLKNLDFGDYLVKLDSNSIVNDISVETLKFPSPLTEIPDGALGNTFISLKDLYIPDSVKSISSSGLSSSGSSFVVHASKGSAGEAFAKANGLQFVEYNSTIHVPVTGIKQGKNLTLSWSPVSGVSRYEVVSIDNKTYHYSVLASDLTGTTYTFNTNSLVHSSTIYVRAYKDGKYWDADPADGYTEFVPTVTGLDITLPEKTYYYYTEADVTGGTMVVHYDDGTSETVAMDNSMITGFSRSVSVSDLSNLYITYKEFETYVEIPITPLKEQSIKITTLPTKLDYYRNDLIDVEGGAITVYYDNGYEEVKPLSRGMVGTPSLEALGKHTVTVSFWGMTDTFEVNVVERPIESVDFVPPENTIVVEGKTLNPLGGKFILHYTDGSSYTLQLSSDMLSEYDNRTYGEQTVTATYMGYSFDFTITVKETEPHIVRLGKAPDRVVYVKGEELEPSGGRLMVWYDNGVYTNEYMGSNDVKLSGYDPMKVGKQTITATYYGMSVTFEVTVRDDVESVTVTPPTVTEYFYFEDLRTYGGSVTATFSDGTQTVKQLTDDMIGGYDKMKIGKQTVSASMGKYSGTFEVTVKPLDVRSVSGRIKKDVYVLGEEIDTTGLSLRIYQNDGSITDIPSEYLTLGEYDNTVIGWREVTVSCGEYSGTVFVSFNEPAISKITLTPPTKLTYFKYDQLDVTGGKLTVSYENGTSREVPLTTAMVSGYDRYTLGRQNLTVTYNNLTVTFDVNVISVEVSGITISKLPTKTQYFVGESLNIDGGEMTVQYNDGTSKVMTLYNAGFNGYDKTKTGTQTITVSYYDFTDTFTVTVSTPSVTGITVTAPTKTTYYTGEDLDLTGGKVKATYNYGDPVTKALTSSMISGYDKTKTGKQTITVTYEGKTATFTVTVNAPSVTGITVTAPTKTTYYTGEDLDLTGGKVKATYNYGDPVTKALTSSMISGYDKTKAGKQTITVTYEGKTATFDVTVNEPEDEEFEIVDGVLISYNGNDTEVTVPDTVTKIGKEAFKNRNDITNIVLPLSVTAIESSAFYRCTSLTSLTLPQNITTIADKAFYGCSGLTVITLPKYLDTIASTALTGCTSLESIDIPLTNTKYRSWSGVLYDKSRTTLIRCPAAYKSVDDYWFSSNVTTIAERAFQECKYLTKISIPDTVTTISNYAFIDCVNLKSIKLPSKLTAIPGYCFIRDTSLETITIPDTVTSIGRYSFYMSGLKNVVIPKKTASIEPYAFAYCEALTSIKIPNYVTTVREHAFAYCDSLTEAVIGKRIQTLEEYAFMSDPALKTVYFRGSEEQWNALNFKASVFSDTHCTLSFDYNDDFNVVNGVLKSYEGEDTVIVIPDNVKSIGEGAFRNCDIPITSITLSDSVTGIERYAFAGCKSLTQVNISKSVSFIGAAPFSGCTALERINVQDGNTSFVSKNGVLYSKDMKTLVAYPCALPGESYTVPSTVTSIYERAFANNKYLVTINIAGQVKTICDRTFMDCEKLKYITLPDSITTIEGYSFLGSEELESIRIPDAITAIERYTFYGSGIKSIVFPANIKTVGTYAFAYCNRLTSVTIPDTVTTLYDHAFSNCDNLSKVIVGTGVTSIQTSAFMMDPELKIVYYKGSEAQWNKIDVDYSAFYNTECTISFDYKPAPTKPVITAAPGDGKATLTWDAVDGAVKYAAYLVQDDGTLKALATRLTDTTYTATKLTNGQTYKFVVRAYVDGKWTTYTDDDIVSCTLPATKPVVTAVPGDGEVMLTWTAVDGATKYAAYCVDAAGAKKCLSSKLTVLTCTAKKLNNGETYKFYVRAYVNGAWSKFTDADMVECTPASTKPVPEAEPADKQVTLTWDAIDGATKYAVYRLQDDGTLKALATKLTVTEYTVKKLTNHTEYKFLVRAYINGKWTKYDESDYVTCTPAALKPLVRVSEYDSMVTLRWGAVDDATKYAAYIVNDDGSLTCVSSKITNIKYTIKNLTNGTTYRFVVRAYVNGKWTKYTDRDIVSATPNA